MTDAPPNPPRQVTAVRAAVEKTLMRWPVARIRPDPNQPRKTFDERHLDALARSLAAQGQLAPIIGYPDPAEADWLVVLDGECRLRAARRVPLEFLDAVVLPGPPTPAELLLAQLGLGQVREKLSAPELADAYARLMSEFGLTQRALADKLGTSETKVSNVFAVRRVLPELRARAATLEPSVVPVIARLPEADQSDVMAFATAAGDGGRLPSRDEIQAFIAARKPAKGARAKAFAGTLDGHRFRIELHPTDTHETIVELLKGLVAVVQRYKAVPVNSLGQVAGG